MKTKWINEKYAVSVHRLLLALGTWLILVAGLCQVALAVFVLLSLGDVTTAGVFATAGSETLRVWGAVRT